MQRPNKEEYLSSKQFTFDDKIDIYYEQLEKYCDWLEIKSKQGLPTIEFDTSIKLNKKQYEFKLFITDSDNITENLNKEGLEGWELITVSGIVPLFDGKIEFVTVLQRELSNPPQT